MEFKFKPLITPLKVSFKLTEFKISEEFITSSLLLLAEEKLLLLKPKHSSKLQLI